MERKAFLDQEAPPGYQAGIGRGATGFTTSADSGPAKFESSFGNEIKTQPEPSETGILVTGNSADDEEADRIYDEIEQRLQNRRRKRPQSDLEVKEKDIPLGYGTIEQQFSLYKSNLAEVSVAEWAALPEVGDLTRRNKRQRLLDQQLQRTYAAPDTLIAGAGSGGPALESVASGVTVSDIEKWEQGHAAISDLEKGRAILASLRKTEPHKPDLWISSARLEEQAKEFSRAKAYISKGCALNSSSEDIWLENLRLHRAEGTKVCKAIVNEALRLNTRAEKLWFAALNLENQQDYISRRRVLMKALEYLPSSADLWKALIGLEENEQEKVPLLTRATELCPTSWELWLNLMNILEYRDAKSVLNRARKALPSERRLWLTALKLEERENDSVLVDKLLGMLRKARLDLLKTDSLGTNEDWFSAATAAQSEGFSKTAQAIVISVVESNTPLENVPLAEKCAAEYPEIARYVFEFIVNQIPNDLDMWCKLLQLLRSRDDANLFVFYKKALEQNPDESIFYLMYAKDVWLLKSDANLANEILSEACEVLPSVEDLWVARSRFALRTQSLQKALEVSTAAIEVNGNSCRLWLKHIHILRAMLDERSSSNARASILESSQKAIDLFPSNYKVYLQRSQIYCDLGDFQEAREVLTAATRVCSDRPEVWTALSTLDVNNGAASKARSLLDRLIVLNPKEPKLWLAKIELELGQDDLVTARQLLNRALKLFPLCPELWVHYLKLIPKMSHRKNAFLDALKQTDNSPRILNAIGVFFWLDGKFPKAKSWFDRALSVNATDGDTWAWLYCFYGRHGRTEELQNHVCEFEKRFDDVNLGEIFIRIVKDPKNLTATPKACLTKTAEMLLATPI